MPEQFSSGSSLWFLAVKDWCDEGFLELKIFISLKSKKNKSKWTGGRRVWIDFIAPGMDFRGDASASSLLQEVTDIGRFPVFTLHPPVFSFLIATVHRLHSRFIRPLTPSRKYANLAGIRGGFFVHILICLYLPDTATLLHLPGHSRERFSYSTTSPVTSVMVQSMLSADLGVCSKHWKRAAW